MQPRPSAVTITACYFPCSLPGFSGRSAEISDDAAFQAPTNVLRVYQPVVNASFWPVCWFTASSVHFSCLLFACHILSSRPKATRHTPYCARGLSPASCHPWLLPSPFLGRLIIYLRKDFIDAWHSSVISSVNPEPLHSRNSSQVGQYQKIVHPFSPHAQPSSTLVPQVRQANPWSGP